MVGDHIVRVKGYSVFRQDQNTEGGGILLYVRNDLIAKVLMRSKTSLKGKPGKLESILCAVWSKRVTPLLVAVVYRPLDVSLRKSKLVHTLRSACPECSQKIIIGDLNAN